MFWEHFSTNVDQHVTNDWLTKSSKTGLMNFSLTADFEMADCRLQITEFLHCDLPRGNSERLYSADMAEALTTRTLTPDSIAADQSDDHKKLTDSMHVRIYLNPLWTTGHHFSPLNLISPGPSLTTCSLADNRDTSLTPWVWFELDLRTFSTNKQWPT